DSLGLKTALIKEGELGGTCLNRGCIPTKFLVQTAKILSQTKKAAQYGLEISNPSIKISETKQAKDNLVKNLRDKLDNLISSKKNITLIRAKAQLISKNEISLGEEKISCKYILIASGSRPKELANLKFDNKKMLSSDQILKLETLPKNILIIGGGVIGCEFASVFSNLATEVTIVEFLERLLPPEDPEVSKKLESLFKKRKITIKTKTDAETLDLNAFEKVLLCTGRAPNNSGIGLEEIGIRFEKGRVITDEYMRTNIENIYAAGDSTSTKQLAHVAAHQAVLAIENMAGIKTAFDYRLIPNCIFTDPEVASVGMDENIAQECAIETIVDRFDFMGSSMAKIIQETDGFIKIISDKQTDKVLGAAIIGPRATELIAILSVVIHAGMKRKDLGETIFAHPTLSEAIGEALRKGLHGF
ncbi:MAG: dihydrolipoyl dehydrogenase, partial [Candidatus Omnitrophica bacterium]|nr:dihydrolipoyl dehydrogenase [Candidatus Omnitrophota bacterium]